MADSGITQLQMDDTKVGTGAEARPGRVVRVHYTGWLYDATKPDKRGAEVRQLEGSQRSIRDLPLGAGRVIKGWDEAVRRHEGGRHAGLTIPPAIGYGARGAGGVIPRTRRSCSKWSCSR